MTDVTVFSTIWFPAFSRIAKGGYGWVATAA